MLSNISSIYGKVVIKNSIRLVHRRAMIYNCSKVMDCALGAMALFRLQSLGYHYVHQNGLTVDRPDGVGFYVFVFFKSEAEVRLGDRMVRVEPNHFILYRPGVQQFYRAHPLINDWMHFFAAGREAFLDGLTFPFDTPVKAGNPLLISRQIMELQNTRCMGGPLCERIVDVDIQSLLLKLCNKGQGDDLSERSRRYLQPFTELRGRLYGAPQTHYSVDRLAAEMHLSKSYFQHIYRELFGCAVMDDIIAGRLEYAQFLLGNSTLDVGEISGECGYSNYAHFMRQFKKMVGMTPGMYRAQGRG